MRKTKKKKRTHVPLRMNMLFFVVFVLFSCLILRLGIVQIVHGQDYKRELERTDDVTVNTSVPRGKIYDRNHKLIVGNKPLNAITYTRSKTTSQQEILDEARKLATIIKKDTPEDFKAITVRDRKDYWIMLHPEEAKAKITTAEWNKFKANKLSDKDLYQLQLDRITDKEMNSFSKQQLEVLAIYREMASGYALSPQIVKNKSVTPKEYAIVNENLSSLPGVDTTTDWERYNVFKNDTGDAVLGSVLGNVSSSKEGLPKELVDYYLSRGYSRNDRVGKSYLEYQYEDVLQGQKEKVKNKTDKSGNVLESEVVSKGKRGDDLVLSIDIDLQQKVEKIIQKELAKNKPGHRFLDRAFVSVMNPNTGELLTMAGKQYVTDSKTGKTVLADYALGNMTTSYSPGSVVKAATVLTGYQTGVIHPGEVQVDQPLKFAGTNVKKSWRAVPFGAINDLTALKVSSNVYMMWIAMKIGGQYSYVPNGPLSIDKMKAIQKLRYNFNQFGLGVKTGIDLPGESSGVGNGIPPESGKVLDFAFGQYDTYTPLQLVQYISTIANGGYRIQPHIVKEIREPSVNSDELGPVIDEIKPNVLNKLSMKTSWIDHVKEGLWKVVNEQGGTAHGYIDSKYKVAAKTGTAQGLYDGPKANEYWKRNELPPMTWNVTFVGYAPYDHPEVAISVVVPWSYEGAQKDPHVNLAIANQVFKAYFDLKAKRAKDGLDQSKSTQKVENAEDTKIINSDMTMKNTTGSSSAQ
ncbi:penicillin-binding protein 2 [Bacillus sp. FJAT-49736]|uniref:peptidoglycan D,D-transpeptidase FtsI family protein n=1 Tax=Bacillus sp. FJAT-49736 TaxID=2833582 RepID=UPI0024B61660|nr:penicillin-binding protein 2 [Bacillus sp. FJAT-49736]